jgi:hypothetical protein
MTRNLKPTHTLPGAYIEEMDEEDTEVVNDSFGTVDIADSSGIEDEMETGDAKVCNFDTHED